MLKKIAYSLIVGILTIALSPSVGLCRHGYYGGHGHYHGGHHNNDAWVWWGLGGLVIGSALTAAVLQPPPQQVVYSPPPIPAYSTYKPDIPPGMCRWERTVLDNYGRAFLDQYGRPVLEYPIGSCRYPPN